MPTFQIILSALLAVCVLAGISMMSKVQTAVRGNLLSALAMLVGVVATLFFAGVVSVWTIYVAVIIGTLIGSQMARKVQMIQMPQTVALFNGLGGGASALVGMLSALGIGFSAEQLSEISASGYTPFVHFTGLLAVAVGMVTLVGSLVAAGKLHRVLNQRPVVWGSASLHSVLTLIAFFFTLWCVADPLLYPDSEDLTTVVVATAAGASFFGLLFAIRVGGADMPITISLLNSLSGVAGSIAGMAISDVFLVAVGGIVGASGLLLTQIMCRAMNRSLLRILVPDTQSPARPSPSPAPCAATPGDASPAKNTQNPTPNPELVKRVMDLEKKIQELEEIVKNLEGRVQTLTHQLDEAEKRPAASVGNGSAVAHTTQAPTVQVPTAAGILSKAKDVIIVPGYGMALAQAQHQVRQLADKLASRGARVRYAIHPVAGRMPGHMNVLLAEADVDYEQLFEMEAINDDFQQCDAVVVIGANDVLNPAARNAEGTPIYGMPVLNVDQAPEVIVCNFDLKPGYAGVENPLYTRDHGVYLELGDAKETLMRLINAIA